MIKFLWFLILQTKCGWGSSINYMAILYSRKVDSAVLGGVFHFLIRLVQLSCISGAFPLCFAVIPAAPHKSGCFRPAYNVSLFLSGPSRKRTHFFPNSQNSFSHPVSTPLNDFNSVVFPTCSQPPASIFLLSCTFFFLKFSLIPKAIGLCTCRFNCIVCLPFPPPQPQPSSSSLTH